MFIKELQLYVDHLKNKVKKHTDPANRTITKSLQHFQANLLEGIDYYKKLFADTVEELKTLHIINAELSTLKAAVQDIKLA